MSRPLRCDRCHRDHDPVSLAEWTWRVRDIKPKPRAAGWVLWMLAGRLSPTTGCGWTTVQRLADDAGVSRSTAQVALAWAVDQLLLRQVMRGHNIDGRLATGSLWVMLPANPTSDWPDVGHEPTSGFEGPNVRKTGHPTSGQSVTKRAQEDNPERKPEPSADEGFKAPVAVGGVTASDEYELARTRTGDWQFCPDCQKPVVGSTSGRLWDIAGYGHRTKAVLHACKPG